MVTNDRLVQLEIPLCEKALKRNISLSVGPTTFLNDLKYCWRDINKNPDTIFDVNFLLWPSPDCAGEPKARWISANLLIHILTFIQALKLQKKKANVTVELFPTAVVKMILEPEQASNVTLDSLKDVVALVRFYSINKFLELLAAAGALTVPSATYFEALKEKLGVETSHPAAHATQLHLNTGMPLKDAAQYYFSSTMMPVVSLVNTPLENSALAHRLGNVKNILRNQIYREKTTGSAYEANEAERKAEAASTIFMFELVSNIYQHAFGHMVPLSRVYGYTAAQIVRFPQGHNAQVHLNTFARLKGLPDNLPHKELSQRIRFLSLTVSDFGIGLVERVRLDLINKARRIEDILKTADAVVAEKAHRLRQWLQNACAYDGHQLLMLAATTPYTSKTDMCSLSAPLALKWIERDKIAIEEALRQMQEAANKQQRWEEVVEIIEGNQILRHILHPAGFGLGYCLLFVARHFGTLTITSGNDEVTFNAKEKAYAVLDSGELDLTDGLDLLQSCPTSLFDIESRTIMPDCLENNDGSQIEALCAFSGTQVQIDVPVLFRWADREPDHRAREQAWLEELHGRIIKT